MLDMGNVWAMIRCLGLVGPPYWRCELGFPRLEVLVQGGRYGSVYAGRKATYMHDHAHDISLGLSFFLGALHALEPGHGKTAMLAYLMGEKRSLWHPILLGVSTAAAHSASLCAIAFAVHLSHHALSGDHSHQEHVSGVLQWVSAAIVVGVGGLVLWQAQAGRVNTCCGGHHGMESHRCTSHSAPSSASPTGHLPILVSPTLATPRPRRTLACLGTTAMLGLAAGLLPCPSALAAFFTGLSSGSPANAYWIVGLFAGGIAASLSVVGILLQWFGASLANITPRASQRTWARLRGAIILGVGLYYVARLTVAT